MKQAKHKQLALHGNTDDANCDHYAMGQSGLLEACQRFWSEAMDSLLHEYHEVIEERCPLIAA